MAKPVHTEDSPERLRELLVHMSQTTGQRAIRVELAFNHDRTMTMFVTHSMGPDAEEAIGEVIATTIRTLSGATLADETAKDAATNEASPSSSTPATGDAHSSHTDILAALAEMHRLGIGARVTREGRPIAYQSRPDRTLIRALRELEACGREVPAAPRSETRLMATAKVTNNKETGT